MQRLCVYGSWNTQIHKLLCYIKIWERATSFFHPLCPNLCHYFKQYNAIKYISTHVWEVSELTF